MIFNIYLVAKKRKHPPLGLGYIKTYAEKNLKKIKITIIELNNYDDILDKKLYPLKPDMIGFSCYENPQIFITLCFKLKKKYGNIITLLGGPAITTSFYDKLDYKKSVDYIIIGEGEETFVELLNHILDKKKNIGEIKGLGYFERGKITFNPLREPILDINKIPSPYLSMVFNFKNYTEFYIEGSRGCLYQCNYCAVSNRFLGYRKFDIKRTLKELDTIIKENPGTKSIEFCDSDIFHDIKRAEKIFKKIKKINKKIFFNFNTEATRLNEEIADWISKPNITVAFGIQTLTEPALIQTNRFFDMDKIKANIIRYKDKLQNIAQPFVLSCIYGLPGDNFENFRKTIEFGLETQARLDFFKLMIWKNTGFEKIYKKYNIKFSKRYPYYIISTDTYKKEDITKTEKILNEIHPVIKIAEKDRFFSDILDKVSLTLKSENKHLFTYELFAHYIKRNGILNDLIKELLKVDRFEYMNKNHKKRFELYNKTVEFMLEVIKKKKTILKDDYYKTVFETLDMIKNTEIRLSLKADINFYLKETNRFIDTDKYLNVKWMDFNIESEKIIDISDKFCDKTEFDPSHKTISIEDFNETDFKNQKTILWNIFSWLKEKDKEYILKNRKEIIIIDVLNSEDFKTLKSRFNKINSYKIGKVNLYICKK